MCGIIVQGFIEPGLGFYLISVNKPFQPSPPVSLSPSSAVPMDDVSMCSGIVIQVRTTTLKILIIKIQICVPV